MIVDPLHIYITVVEQANFSKAAQLLHLSQPNVSLHIRNLENELGMTLLHRTSKQVQMTEAGEILYKHAKQIWSLYEQARQEIHLLREVISGTIRIGASFTIGEYILPRMLVQFTEKHPHVDVQIMIGNSEEITKAIRYNELDLGLIEGTATQADVELTSFMKDQLILVACRSHPLAERGAISDQQLQDQVWIVREAGSGTRSYNDQFIQQAKLRIKRTFEFNSNQGVKEAVIAGLGIAILSEWVVQKELQAGELIALSLPTELNTRNFSLIQMKDSSPSMAIRKFKEHVHAFSLRDQ